MAIKHSATRPVISGGRSGFKAPKGSDRVARRNAQSGSAVSSAGKKLAKKR